MAVLSVDLAYGLWSHLGIVVLDRMPPQYAPNPLQSGPGLPLRPPFAEPDRLQPNHSPIACEIIPPFAPGLDENLVLAPPGPVDANLLAGRLNHLCGVRGIRILMLDGPQAWKSRSNGLEHARVSDRQLNRALHTVVVCRLRHDPATRAYVERRLKEGKSHREIKRCLKRYVARQLYRLLENPVGLDTA